MKLLLIGVLLLSTVRMGTAQSIVMEVGRCFEGSNVFTNETISYVLYEYQCNYFIFYNRSTNSSQAVRDRDREGFILLSVVLLVFFLFPCCLVCLHAGCSAKSRRRSLRLIKRLLTRDADTQ